MGFKPIATGKPALSLFQSAALMEGSDKPTYNYLARLMELAKKAEQPQPAVKLKRPHLTRKIGKSLSRHVKRYSTNAGEILWAWNTMHAILAATFVVLVGELETALGIWHTIKTDTGQRDALRAILLAKEGELTKRLVEEIEWVLDVIDHKLSQHRNDVVHVPMKFFKPVDALVPDYRMGDPKRTKRLNRTDREDFHRKLKGDLVQIASYAQFLLRRLGSPIGGSVPWPHRPRMQSIPRAELPLTRSQKLRRSKPAKRRTRRKSSPA